jgi:hypothetical protein
VHSATRLEIFSDTDPTIRSSSPLNFSQSAKQTAEWRAHLDAGDLHLCGCHHLVGVKQRFGGQSLVILVKLDKPPLD